MQSEEEYELYERQSRLELWDQDIIKNASAVIAGTGGIGGEIAKNLALMGVGKLTLIDADTIEFSNLNRQLLFRRTDVGKPKATVTAERILDFNPQAKVVSYANKIQEIPMKVFQEADVIMGCLDNFLGRQYLNSLSTQFDTPLIDGASEGYLAQVRVVWKGKTACLACDNPPPPEETRTLDMPCTVVGKPRIREHCAWKALYQFFEENDRMPNDADISEMNKLTETANKIAVEFDFAKFEVVEVKNLILFRIPSIITVNSIISGIQSQEFAKTMFVLKRSSLPENQQERLRELETQQRFHSYAISVYSGLSGNLTTYDLLPDPDCPVCGHLRTFREIQVGSKEKIRELVQKLEQQDLVTSIESTLLFRGDKWLDPEDSIIEAVYSGDIVTVSQMESDEEFSLRVNF